MTDSPGRGLRVTQFNLAPPYEGPEYLNNGTTTRPDLHNPKQTGGSTRITNKLSKNQAPSIFSNLGSAGSTIVSKNPLSLGRGDHLAEPVSRTSPWDLYTPQFKLKLNGYALVAESSQHAVVAVKRFPSTSQTDHASSPQLMKNAGGHRNLMLPISIHLWENYIYLIFDYTPLSLAQVVRSPAQVCDQHLAEILRQVCFQIAIAF